MPRIPSPLLLLAIPLALVAPRSKGQTAPVTAPASPAPADDLAASPIFTAQASAPTPAPPLKDSHGEKPQIQTAELATALAGSLPAYAPPVPAAPKAEAQVDLDIPRNHVIRLPKVVVHDGSRPVVPKLTPQERADLAMQRYVINVKDMPAFAAGVARALFQGYADQNAADAARADGIADLKSEARDAAAGGDTGESDFIKAESADVFMRHQDWAAPVPTDRPNESTPR